MPLVSAAGALAVALFSALFLWMPCQWRPRALLVASLVFAGLVGGVWAALLPVFLCAFTFVALPRLEAGGRGATWALGGLLSALLGSLVLAKYALPLAGLAVVVPLGLSYYVFKLTGHALDVHWGRVSGGAAAEALLVSATFFPQLPSGPIQMPADLMPQLARLAPDRQDIVVGLRLVLFGALKKLVVADNLAPLVDNVFGSPASMTRWELLIGAYAFSLQLYADFSGLTDIARGIARVFGVRSPENFRLPFWAPDLAEFWRRWHMTLTQWLGEYLFTPLHLALRSWGPVGAFAAVFVNMVAVGVWHGPTAGFLAFGVLNGLMLGVSALTLRQRNRWFRRHPALVASRRVLGTLTTSHLMVAAFAVFRCPDMATLSALVAGLASGGHQRGIPVDWAILGLPFASFVAIVALAAVLECGEAIKWAPTAHGWFEALARPTRWALYYAGLLILLYGGATEPRLFIYAQF